MRLVNEYVNLLKASGLTQQALAKEMGVSARSYSKWVHGNAKPVSSKSKAALALARAKYGNKRKPRPIPPVDVTPAEIVVSDDEIKDVPDFDPEMLKRACKASGLTVADFAKSLNISSDAQYYRYASGRQQARKRSIRKTLYDACQTVEPAPEGETNPQARTRGRSVISEDRIKERVERFERTELLEYEREYVRRALRFAAQEQGMVPRELREAMVTVLATVQGRVPLGSLSALLMGTDP